MSKILYYLSKTPIELLIPRVPTDQDSLAVIPRISFSTSIQGCLAKLMNNIQLGEQFKVYALETDDYYKPALSEAPYRDITEELWVQNAVEPDYCYDIEITGKIGQRMEEALDQFLLIPQWDYKILNKEVLAEDTRTLLVSKSRSVGPYKNQMRGKNRFERKKHSQIAKTVKQYNKIDMNKLFKEDILEVAIPVTGETDSYTVNIRMEGVIKEIARNIKNNKNKLEFRTIVQSLTKVFNSANIFVKCSCPDYKYRFAHWNIVNRVSVDDTSKDPGPGKGIVNPRDDKGRGCKHVLLCLANGDWIMKVASVINNYIHYAEEKLQKPFLKLIFPKLYGVPFDEVVENDLLPDDFELDSSESIIDAINDYGKNRGKILKGSNINPVYADKLSAEQKKKADKEKQSEKAKHEPESSEKPKEATKHAENKKAPEEPKTAPEAATKDAKDAKEVNTDEEDNKAD